MIEAAQFVEAARERGFDWYAGVPCSFLTPFINYVLQDPTLRYVTTANEGDAVALIAGSTLGARDGGRNGGRGITIMQNSGLGNAVSPLTSLTWTFRLPQLLIVTWRGQPGLSDEPQHALMGPITPAMLDIIEIPWEVFPTDAEAVGPAIDRALMHMDKTGLPYALVMQKDSVAPYALKNAGAEFGRELCQPHSLIHPRGVVPTLPTRHAALRRVIEQAPLESSVVFASTGFCGRELYAIDDRANQLYMVGSMGCVTSFALGFALARPDLHVIVLDGDGAALMRMGAFATLGAYGPSNLTHVLFDNGVHDSTGGQATVSSQVSFARIAAACGYGFAIEGDTLDVLSHISSIESQRAGPRFIGLSIKGGTPGELPRPTVTPVDIKTRLMRHIEKI